MIAAVFPWLSWQGFAEDMGRYLFATKAGLLTSVEGRPTVSRIGRFDKSKRMLESGTCLKTGHGDKAEVSLGPGNYLRVGENTRVEIVETAFDRMHLAISQGVVILQTPRLKKNVLSLKVSTPGGDLIPVKGAKWRLEVTPDGTVEIFLYRGMLEWFRNPERMATLNHGNHYSLRAPAVPEFQQVKLEHRHKDDLDRWSDHRAEILLRQEGWGGVYSQGHSIPLH